MLYRVRLITTKISMNVTMVKKDIWNVTWSLINGIIVALEQKLRKTRSVGLCSSPTFSSGDLFLSLWKLQKKTFELLSSFAFAWFNMKMKKWSLWLNFRWCGVKFLILIFLSKWNTQRPSVTKDLKGRNQPKLSCHTSGPKTCLK